LKIGRRGLPQDWITQYPLTPPHATSHHLNELACPAPKSFHLAERSRLQAQHSYILRDLVVKEQESQGMKSQDLTQVELKIFVFMKMASQVTNR
jgi:hypothetical protein